MFPHSSPSPSSFYSFLLSRHSILFLTGDLTQLQLPVGMKDLHLFDTEVTGDITQINLPVGMQSVNFRCTGLTGDLAQLQLPVGMKEVDLSGTEMTGTLPASE